MSVFPDIAKYGFKEIEFLSHLPDGFDSIKKYLLKMRKDISGKELWLYNLYERKKIPHLILLGFIKTEINCSNIIIKINRIEKTNSFRMENKKIKMNSKEFLRIFNFLLRKQKKYKPLRVAYSFSRIFKNPLFSAKSGRNLFISGFKLQGTKKSPLDFVLFEQLRDSKVKVRIHSKPLFAFEKKSLNNIFFKAPIQHMIDVSDAFYKGLGEEKNGK